jgi:hypothetical protein
MQVELRHLFEIASARFVKIKDIEDSWWTWRLVGVLGAGGRGPIVSRLR